MPASVYYQCDNTCLLPAVSGGQSRHYIYQTKNCDQAIKYSAFSNSSHSLSLSMCIMNLYNYKQSPSDKRSALF